MIPAILFISKRGGGYGGCYRNHNSGLHNSIEFLVEMLNDEGILAKHVEVVDNNDIDREVYLFKPTVVVIEALWVIPEKFEILKALHPKVVWIVRIHSDCPFFEGITVDWLYRCAAQDRVYIATNSIRVFDDFKKKLESKILFLPNYYPLGEPRQGHEPEEQIVNIGCFGAIRPLKNQLNQAIAAIKYADKTGRYLKFYVNASRCESGGEEVLKNLRSLFRNSPHNLVECHWYEHRHFLKIMAKMDISMSVSFSETFCIVAADAVNCGVPIVVSEEVPWATGMSECSPNDVDDIVDTMGKIENSWLARKLNRRNIANYNENSKRKWLELFYSV